MVQENITASDAADNDASVATAEADGGADVAETPTEPAEATPAPRSVIAPQPELRDALTTTSYSAPEDAPRKEVPGARNYEIIYIVRVGSADTADTVANRLRALIDTNGAVDNVRTSEPRRLAYPIDREIEGIYVVVNARFVKELTGELDRFFKLEEAVLRHMILRDEE